MAVAEKQQECPQVDCSEDENDAFMAIQVSLKDTQSLLRNDVKKAEEAGQSGTAENRSMAVTEEALTISNDMTDKADKQLCSEGFTACGGRELPAEGHEEEDNAKKMDSVVIKKSSVSLSHKFVEKKMVEEEEVIGESVEQFEAAIGEEMEQLTAWKNKETMLDTDSNSESAATIAVMSLAHDNAQLKDETRADKMKDFGERKTIAALSLPQETMDIVVDAKQSVEGKEPLADTLNDVSKIVAEDLSVWVEGVEHPLSTFGEASQPSSAEVKETVNQIVATLVDDVVDSIDAKSAKAPRSSACMPHLSADEAMELLEAHQGDDSDLLPEHDEVIGAVMEAESKHHGYQWFDGDEEDDDEIVLQETTDDVFGFDGVVDLADHVTRSIEDFANTHRAGSADAHSVFGNSSRSSSSTSSSSSSSSASSCSYASSSEDESDNSRSKKRRVSGNNDPRKLLQHKKQKRVCSSEPSNSSLRQHKRKRKIPKPVIPSEFAVFDTKAADPILKGSYFVRKNRRACFNGYWGFTEEAFQKNESISPFEYTSQARVLQSRRKDDKCPISGKYGGFFKLRQFNGSLVKVREDQVDLQFLPMPSSDEEDEDMMGYESNEGDNYEVAASRYIVLGKGKNRFGRFLIQGYLSPESGRLTVKRRYLE